ncbi:MAG: GerMN domain-containing protein [Oscillospiraceae bacterium]|nr:GerMN domain-containing protein [Oscillospiraceae bacterium]
MKKMILLLMCCLMLTACAAPATPTPPPTQVPTEATVPPTETPTEAPTEPPLLTFSVYSANEHADGFIETQVETTEITVELVMEKLIDAAVINGDTALNSFEPVEDTLFLDFNSVFADQINSMGTAGERMIMGSVVNTFLSAFDGDFVMITVDGEILESGHVVYDVPLEFFN